MGGPVPKPGRPVNSGKGTAFLGSALGKAPAPPKARKPIPARSAKQAKRKAALALEARGNDGLTPPQRSCQHPDCETPDAPLVAHHVVYQQHLRQFGGDAGDANNTISLCTPCHLGKQHNQASPLPVSSLTPDNIAYAYGLMGADRAEAYLSRRYQPAVVE